MPATTRQLLELDTRLLDIPRESGVVWRCYSCAWCNWFVVCKPSVENPIGDTLQHLLEEHGIRLG